ASVLSRSRRSRASAAPRRYPTAKPIAASGQVSPLLCGDRSMSLTYGGIDLGGTKIQAILLDAGSGKVLGQSRRPTPTQGGPQAIVQAMASTLGQAADEAKL